MAREKTVSIGSIVQLKQNTGAGVDVWLPFIVTHVYQNDIISGIGCSGEPGAIGWSGRGTEAYNSVTKGDANRQWRFPVKVEEQENSAEQEKLVAEQAAQAAQAEPEQTEEESVDGNDTGA